VTGNGIIARVGNKKGNQPSWKNSLKKKSALLTVKKTVLIKRPKQSHVNVHKKERFSYLSTISSQESPVDPKTAPFSFIS
jgi:hypothetical protein